MGIRKIDSLIALIFGTRIDFLDLCFLDKFTIVLLAFLLILTTLLLLVLNAIRAKFDNQITFNSKVNGTIILLKLKIKR